MDTEVELKNLPLAELNKLQVDVSKLVIAAYKELNEKN